MTTVININTGDKLTYGLPPNEAVVAAHQQVTKKNMNTWTYDFTAAVKLGFGWACGNFWAPDAVSAS